MVSLLSMEETQSGCSEPAAVSSRLSGSGMSAPQDGQHQHQPQPQPTADGDQMDLVTCDGSDTFQPQPAGATDDSSSSGDGQPDDEQLRRILMCKRLSEGCNRFVASPGGGGGGGHSFVNRKNSLHMIGQELPPLTEGEPMRHQSYHFSQNMESLASSSGSSGSLRSGGGGGAGARHHQSQHQHQLAGLLAKRNSQDDNGGAHTNSCSSSTSLDGSGGGGGPRSPSRRRSSTVSQCSSVLSEGTRQQLNFDLSPDLAPDASLTEANAISPTDFDRPASPEPSSLASGEGENSLDATRPVSRMSQCNATDVDDELMMAASPDSTLGDSNDGHSTSQHAARRRAAGSGPGPGSGSSPPAAQLASIIHSVSGFGETHHSVTPNEENNDDELRADHRRALSESLDCRRQYTSPDKYQQHHHETVIRDNLERIISEVSTVKVSSDEHTRSRQQQQQPTVPAAAVVAITQSVAQKRAHTPFETDNRQRSKSSPKGQQVAGGRR